MSPRGELRRQARLDAKLDQYLESGFMPMHGMNRRHAVCARCNRRRILALPAFICESKCLLELIGFAWAVEFFGGKL